MSTSASLVWEVPVFDFFKTYAHGVPGTLHRAGDIHSVAEYNTLVPAPDIRVEIERLPEKEEIRVVKDANGDYHATVNSTVARDILQLIDQQTSEIFEFDVEAYPRAAGEDKKSDFFRSIIPYDERGNRVLPGIRRAGFVSTLEEYQAKEHGAVWVMELEEFVGITDTSNGNVWWATEELKRDILEWVKAADLSCPIDNNEERKREQGVQEVSVKKEDRP